MAASCGHAACKARRPTGKAGLLGGSSPRHALRGGMTEMTSSDDSFGFAPPPFDAAGALVTLRRQLRDMKLAERGSAFEQQGKRVVELAIDADTITVKLARRPASTPDWDRFTLKSAADQRRLVDELKKRMARWEHDE